MVSSEKRFFLDRRGLRMAALVAALGLLSSCGFRRAKYENPIAKDSEQPDKVLFDKAVRDMEKGRYEVARLTLQTLMNTYDTSEYLAKSKLAYADSWFREGGSNGLAQAEAEYKDFILFYPTMEESAEAQEKICMIHYRQMEKADRDPMHALRAEDECRNVLVQFPNSKFAPRVQQLLRNIQEAIADGEFRRGYFYHTKGSHPAASNRLQAMTDHYPLYSKADEANWLLADSYARMGPRFRQKSGDAYARIVREYPLSARVDEAKKRLTSMELPIPEADPVAYNRMKYELENRDEPGILSDAFGIFRRGPELGLAAKSGSPAMTSLRPTVPASVPIPGEATPGFSGDVTVAPIAGNSALDTQPDARANQPGASAPQADGGAAPAPNQPAAGDTDQGAAAQVANGQNPEAGKSKAKNDNKSKKQKKDDKKNKNGK
jgi:outer membrane protein assembly factor BamD